MGVGKISTYTYFGEGGQTHSYVIFSESIFYIRNRAVKWFGSDHISFVSGSIGMSCFFTSFRKNE